MTSSGYFSSGANALKTHSSKKGNLNVNDSLSEKETERIAAKLAIVGVSGNVALSAFKLFAGCRPFPFRRAGHRHCVRWRQAVEARCRRFASLRSRALREHRLPSAWPHPCRHRRWHRLGKHPVHLDGRIPYRTIAHASCPFGSGGQHCLERGNVLVDAPLGTRA